MAYEVPPLPYDYAALEPHIDEATMKLHHDKHHAAYVTKLNGAVEKHPELGKQSPRRTHQESIARSPKTSATSCATTAAATQPLHVLGDHEAQGRRRSHRPHRRPDQDRLRHFDDLQKAVQREHRRAVRLRLGLARLRAAASSPSSPRPTRTIPSPKATTPSSATTSGSTPTTSSTRTSAPTTSRPGGTPSTGTRSTSASPQPRRASQLVCIARNRVPHISRLRCRLPIQSRSTPS